MIHSLKIQFLGAKFVPSPNNNSQIDYLQIWERYLGCTVLWVQHSVRRIPAEPPRHGGHPSEQLKWINRAWRTAEGGPGVATWHGTEVDNGWGKPGFQDQPQKNTQRGRSSILQTLARERPLVQWLRVVPARLILIITEAAYYWSLTQWACFITGSDVWSHVKHTVKRRGIRQQDDSINNSNNKDFPGGPMVKNLPASAGNMGSVPGPGIRIPSAMGQLNPCATNYWAQAL